MDRENVEKALDCRANDSELDCRDCAYYIREDTPAYCNFRQILRDAISLLKEQDNCENCAIAIEDRQPIVRCKDCKKRNSLECWQYFFGRIKIPDDWFCADGERR